MNPNYVHDEDGIECDRKVSWVAFRPGILFSLLFWLLVALIWSRADAATGLAIVTRDASAAGKLVKDAQPVQVYATPKAGDYVRVAPTEAEIWTTGVWKAFGALTSADKYETCTSDTAEETWTNATCTSWDVRAFVPADPSTFGASVVSGQAPLSTVLSWDVKNVTTCNASGSWSGAKAAKGTQAISNLTASATYTLLCTKAASTTGSAALSWTPPTQNTDGTPLTNLTGYRVLYGDSAIALSQTVDVPGAVSGYTLTGLPVNTTKYFTVRAVAGTGESANSGVVSKLITPDSAANTFTRTVGVTVDAAPPVPNPPTLLTIATTAYRYDQTKVDTPRLFAIGTVPLGIACDPKHQVLGLYRVAKAAVTLAPGASVNIALAKCG